MDQERFLPRLKHAWSVFRYGVEQLSYSDMTLYNGNSYRPDRPRYGAGLEKSMLLSLYTRMAIDVSSYPIKHVRVDKNNRFMETIKSDLHEALTLSANVDQTGRALIQDLVISLFDEGAIAVVPTETSTSINDSNSFAIYSLRVGKIKMWFPDRVSVEVARWSAPRGGR